METGKMINCISNRLRNRSQEVHTQLGIGSAQGKILNYVLVESEAHSVYQKDLEREFGLRPSTVTEMLNALEQKKLIQRVSDEWDGRYKKIVFTEKARSMKDRIRQEVEETEHLLLQGITEQEKQEFLRIAGKMLQNLEAERTNEK
ncbi:MULTISPECIES: MarR family transcriptional regulator [unclassified Clostridium]|jgi:DNA-binding MarR family transcriptional regulator|uniref:MarR family winged helix-turn-helix transcriptional regulator n=1 Tax=unclassified Clostridium TaxID=2614128 RepID=UPI000E49CECB|nr:MULTISPECIES: MarR family transcriptional regulator [unclassified Clostridium]RHS84144.1 MarR family transcriptional regulator [Clostridium sp. AM42-4]RHV65085.1 MarR family transcriptional regulator [Clostridium sp. OM02-18AC]RHV86137.1 MarR family transcriptional regulator [Clostridium sp. OF09-36]